MLNATRHLIKGYNLLDRIGAGQYGAVYRCYQSAIGREVAVKVIPPQYASRPTFIRRFETEAQRIARLEHLHIVPLYDYWRDPSGAYLVMRWMRGGSLQQALQDGPLDLKSVARLLDQIAAGLAAAHARGIFHGDLNASNILLDEEGNAYLSDFSIARMISIGDEQSGRKVDRDGSSTAFSMPIVEPELSKGQTDLYSLGVLLHHMLTGREPFSFLEATQRRSEDSSNPLPPIVGLDGARQKAINQVVEKATAKDPEHRFGDVIEMSNAFRAAAQLDWSLIDSAASLTPREMDILDRIVRGLSNREIADDLIIEISTVKWYITQIYRKLGVRSRKQVISRAQGARPIIGQDSDEVAGAQDSLIRFEPANPYKGLRAFDVADAHHFFGREQLIESLVGRLALSATATRSITGNSEPKTGRFLVITGPSGSGKSSLVKAGLIPALGRGAVPGSESWFTVQFTPGSRPLDQLEVALTRVAAEQSANIRRHLDRDAYGLSRVAELILPQGNSELLIVIDQFEEIFTLVAEETARAHFLSLIATACKEPGARVRVILVLRADYYDRPLNYPEFGQLLRTNMETVLPLSPAGLQRAIQSPAEQVGVQFEPGLVETIIGDIHGQPGALPLLQYALTELFEERDGFVLQHTTYQRLGGVAGALVRRAEELYLEQEDEGQQAIRQLFLRLVVVDDDATSTDTRQRVPRSELTAAVTDPDLLDELIDVYGGYRLITLDHDPEGRRPTVEIAHDALLRQWQRLRDWVEESRNDLRMRRDLARSADEWNRAGRDSSFLLRGTRLEQFDAWSRETALTLSGDELDYLQASTVWRNERVASEAARQAREVRLQRRARKVLLALLIVFVAAAVVSAWFALDADRQRREAERSFAISESQRLAAEADSILERGGSNELAALLALQALSAQYTTQADLALQRAHAEHLDSMLIETPGSAFLPLFSPNNRYLRLRRFDANSIDYQRFELWDLETMEPLLQVQDVLLTGYQWTIRDFTDDFTGVVLPLRNDEIELTVIDVASGSPVRTFMGNASPIVTHQLSPDGTVLVAGTKEGMVHVWSVGTGKEIGRFALGGGGYVRSGTEFYVAVSPDNRLVAAKARGQTRVWDIGRGEQRYHFTHVEDWSPMRFVADGHFLLTTLLPDLSLWDLSTGQQVGQGIAADDFLFFHQSVGLGGGEEWVSGDGRLYAQGLVGLQGLDVLVWEVSTGELLHRLTGHTDSAVPVDFTNDSRHLVTRGADGTARVWDMESGRELLVLAAHSSAIMGADLSGDDRYLVTVGEDEAVRIWDLQAHLREAEKRLAGVSNALHFSPDGTMALSSDLETGTAILVKADSLDILHHLAFNLDAAGPDFSSDGRMVVGTQDLERILVYDVASGELLAEHINPDGVYRFAAFVPGRDAIFAGGNLGAYLLDAQTGEQLRVFRTPGAGLFGANSAYVAVSPDGHYGAIHMWTPDSLNMVYLWDLHSGELIYQSTPKPDDVITAFAFSDDSRYFAWGGSSNIAYVLDISRTGEVARLSHLGPVVGLDFSSSNQLLLTSSFSDSVTVWDLETGSVVRQFFTGAGPSGFVDFANDDTSVLYATAEDGVIVNQALTLDALIENVCATIQRDLNSEQRRIYALDNSPSCPDAAGS